MAFTGKNICKRAYKHILVLVIKVRLNSIPGPSGLYTVTTHNINKLFSTKS